MGLPDHSPAPPPAPGQGVVEGAETRLRGNPYLALTNVTCEYHDGVLTLRGGLPTYYLKQRAQEAVGLPGGVRVVNEIEVLPSRRFRTARN